MYENIIGQDALCRTLENEIRQESLPPTLLFSGPPATGKLTTALETARAISCRQSAAWNCSCPDCAMHRRLTHPDLILFGARSLPEEITVAREFLFRNPGTSSAFFFLRSLGKLLARFNPALWSGEEGKLGKAAGLVESLRETMDHIEPDTIQAPLPQELINKIESAYADALSLELLAPEAPVFMLRNMRLWAQLAPLGKRKTVIIENADRMQDSARNAMLKILEEPPDTVRFILLTSRRASMLATVLSRSRLYAFLPRDRASSAQVIARVFKSEEAAESLKEFFDSRMDFPPRLAQTHAQLIAGRILSDVHWQKTELGTYGQSLLELAESSNKNLAELLDELAEITKSFGTKDKTSSGSYIRFLRALLAVFSTLLAESSGNAKLLSAIEAWSRLLREAAIQYSSLNRNPELLARVLVSSFGDLA